MKVFLPPGILIEEKTTMKVFLQPGVLIKEYTNEIIPTPWSTDCGFKLMEVFLPPGVLIVVLN